MSNENIRGDVLEMIENGMIDAYDTCLMLLKWMSTDSIEECLRQNDVWLYDEEEDNE